MMNFNSGCLMKGRDCLPFRRTGFHRRCLVGSMLLICSFLCCVLFCVLFAFVLCLVCKMLPMSLDNPFLIASSKFSKKLMKWKNQKNTTLSELFQKSHRKIVEIGKIDTPNTQIHDSSLSSRGTGISHMLSHYPFDIFKLLLFKRKYIYRNKNKLAQKRLKKNRRRHRKILVNVNTYTQKIQQTTKDEQSSQL